MRCPGKKSIPLIAGACLLWLSACGSLQNYELNQVRKTAQGSASPLTNDTGEDPEYSCPEDPNVIPDYADIDDTGNFTVCRHRNNAAQILVHGTTRVSSTLCIYPVEIVDESHVFTKPDLSQGGAPTFQCIGATEKGVYANFQQMSYNAVFIVEGPDRARMSACLVRGDYMTCPRFSYGRFR